jgi:regulatory protein
LIVRVEPLRPRGLKVRLHLDRGDPLEITLEALERSRLGAGDPLPPDRQSQLLNDDADIRVRDAALNLIAYRARTRAELRTRLRQKGFPPQQIDPCLDRLQDKGFIDDVAVAEAFVRDRLRHRPRGKAALSAELRHKGVATETAGGAIDRAFDEVGTTDVALAQEVAGQWAMRQNARVLAALASEAPSEARDRAHRRLHGYLARRGFRGSALAAGIDHAREAARSGETPVDAP